MRSCDQSLVTVAFLWEKLSQPQFYKDLTRKTAFFEGWSWFKFNNSRQAIGTNFKFYTSVAKGLKLKVSRFLGLFPTFVEVTGEKLVRGPFCPLSILNWVNTFMTDVPTIKKPVHWFIKQINGLVSIWSGPLSWKDLFRNYRYLDHFLIRKLKRK